MKALTEETRAILGKPLGEVFGAAGSVARVHGEGCVVSVGDFCSNLLLENGVHLSILIFDHRCLRAPVDNETAARLEAYDGKGVTVVNPPGFITDELITAVKSALAKGRGKIVVEGEEDLAALVVLMHAEDGVVVVYGQPKEGMVVIKVDESVRERARAVFGKMQEV